MKAPVIIGDERRGYQLGWDGTGFSKGNLLVNSPLGCVTRSITTF
ncbi:hypothetical protein [Parashewanella spongiae]|nr:hypothetical protein [Parashewanella spongiae]